MLIFLLREQQQLWEQETMLQLDKQMKEIKGVAFKNCAPFINCISEINNTQIDDAKDIDIVMPMYNLINIVIIM